MWVVVAVSDTVEDVVVLGAYRTEGAALTIEEDLQHMGYETKVVTMFHGLADVPDARPGTETELIPQFGGAHPYVNRALRDFRALSNGTLK